ncbi:MAG: hypothetical protein NUV86_04875 [Candidatus Scalindua sp.]|nr:hypothetical protein [Candidatus Scalindua sp.]MCR4343503.1 hypothetical protein [Candidatus Scalindua sp.]
MFKANEADSLVVGEKICLFKKGGVLPIACGLLEYFDDKLDKIAINIDKRSVKLTKHLYDFVSASALNRLGQEGPFGRVRQQYLQFSGIMKHEPKT